LIQKPELSERSIPALTDAAGSCKGNYRHGSQVSLLFYRLLNKGQKYVDRGAESYETRHREQQIRRLTKRAQLLGLQVLTSEGNTA
jgi:hypothetical protein